MKKWLLLLLTGISTMAQAYSLDEQQLIDLYREMNTEMVAANVDALDKMLTPDYMLTHMTGYKQSRAEWLAQVKSGEMRYFKTEEVSLKPSINGNSGKLIGRAYTTANIWGIQGTWGLQLDIDYRKENGVWRMSNAVASAF